jgi:hypothetical protein
MSTPVTYPIYLSIDRVHRDSDSIRTWLNENCGPYGQRWIVAPDYDVKTIVVLFVDECDYAQFILTWGAGCHIV